MQAGTPGCTKGKHALCTAGYDLVQGAHSFTAEACAFRDRYTEFKKAGAEVVGISADSPEDQAAFATAQRLPFTLLTDQSDFLRKV